MTTRIWTAETCLEDALRFATKRDWQRNSPTAYGVALRLKMVDKCTAHMKPYTRRTWTYDLVLQKAAECGNVTTWRKKSLSSYGAAVREGWLLKLEENLPKDFFRRRKRWTKEECIADAMKYQTKARWQQESAGEQAARKNGWFKECTAHMPDRADRRAWDKDAILATTGKYRTYKDWRHGEHGARTAASELDIIAEIKQIFEAKKPKVDLIAVARAVAAVCETRYEFKLLNSTLYYTSLKSGLMDEICAHMKPRHRPIEIDLRHVIKSRPLSFFIDWYASQQSSQQAQTPV